MSAEFRILTAEGRGAIAVVRVRGAGAVELIDRVFRPHRGKPIGQTDPGRLRLGRAGVGLGDEVVAVRLGDPTPTVEIHCHGGSAAVVAVIQALEAAGAVPAGQEPADGSPERDAIQAQAMEDLAAAPTLRTAEILLDQANGALSRALERLVDKARTGATIGPASPILPDLDALIRRGDVGIRLIRGWRLVIAGRPNVGKSRLFNAMAGFDRSIVNPRAGVTRDVVTLRTAFGGWPVELADTAGEREGAEDVERIGIDRARQERGVADLVLLVLDRSEPLQEVDRHLLEATAGALIIANKCDRPPAWDDLATRGEAREFLSLSAETGEGLDRLARVLQARLVPEAPAEGVAVPFRREHLSALARSRACLLAGDREGFVRPLEQLRLPGSSSD